jgi:anti-anti-sigma regulatory factor
MSYHQYIRTEVIEDILVLELQDLTGHLPDNSISKEFDLIRHQRREIGVSKVIFDLAHAQFFGSTLLELIRVLWNDLTADGGRLVLCNPSEFGREVLQIAKFDQIWPLFESRTQAFELLKQGQGFASWPASLQELIAKYEVGPQQLRESVSGLTSIQLRIPAPPGIWSALQIVCHIADFELVYADRMKRVVAEEQPTLFGGDPDLFAAKLAYEQRDLEEELDVITSVRRQTSRFLKTLNADQFDRTGKHSVDGPLSLSRLLERIAGHIPHHVQFIEGKKTTLTQRLHDHKPFHN